VPRAVWSGTIAFGLVSVPVRMETAVEEHTLHFNYVHEPDGGRIGYQKVCKAEDRPVPEDEVVKAFEIAKGRWVYLSDEDFESAQLEQTRKTRSTSRSSSRATRSIRSSSSAPTT
jgi:DNA end-binding protein Ku